MANQMKKATALSYSKTDEKIPRVIAKGKGYVAEAIIKQAEDSAIPVIKDERLSEQLQQLAIGAEIPEHLYDVVAQVLVFIAKIDQKKR